MNLAPPTSPSTGPSEPARSQFYGWVLAGVLALQFAMLAPWLIYPDLNLDYPFAAGDSWDWIANGLAHAGERVRFSGRPPLLPMVIAVLHRADALPYLPLLNLAAVQATVWLWFVLTSRLTTSRVAFVVAGCVAASHLRLDNALPVMADSVAVLLLVVASLAFVAAHGSPRAAVKGGPRWYLVAGLAGGASAITQQAALLLPLPVAIAVLASRRQDLRGRWLWAGVASFAALPAAWWAWQRIGPLGPGFGFHGQLLRPHLSGLGVTLFSASSWFGVPAGCAVAIGLVLFLRRRRWADGDGGGRLFLVTLLLTTLIFFAAFYDYHDQRFWIYAFFPASVLLVEVLERVHRATAFWALSAFLSATAAMPLPAGSQGWAALWPLPATYAHLPVRAAASGGAEAAGVPSLVVHSWSVVAANSVWSRVRAARGLYAATPRLAARQFADAEGAVFLVDEENRGDRYQALTRLSNALRTPVKVLPRSWLRLPELRLRLWPLGRHDRYQVYRGRVAGLQRDWLFAAAPGGEADHRLSALAAAAGAEGSGPAMPPPGLLEAQAVSDFLAASKAAYVVMLDREGADWQARLFLPLLLATTEIVVLPEAEEGSLSPFLGRVLDPPRSFGSTLVTRRRILASPGAIIQLAAGIDS